MRKLPIPVVLAALALAHCRPAPPLEGAAPPRPLVVSGDGGSPDAATSATLAELPRPATVCQLPATKVASRAGARPFTRPDGLCKDEATGKPGSCGFAERYDYPPTPSDTCFVADSNLEAAARAIRSGGSPAPLPRLSGTSSLSSLPPPPAPVPGAPWDRKRAPKYLDKVVSHFGLTGQERAMLERNGFVVLDLNAAVAGLDTMYVADTRSLAAQGGVQKWTFDGANWSLAATFKTGLTGAPIQVAAAKVGSFTHVVATTLDNPAKLVRFVDDGGVNPTAVTLATAAANTQFRGVAVPPK